MVGTIYGYARVPMDGQSVAAQGCRSRKGVRLTFLVACGDPFVEVGTTLAIIAVILESRE
jgi:hypothetical protein